MQLRILSSFLLLVCLSVSRSLFAQSFTDPGDTDELAAALVAAMSDEEALAQTFMLGWVGAEPSPLIMDWIRDRHIGGVKIFGWNTGDTLRLAETVGTLQQTALAGKLKIPLLVATDQEGGWIRHVKGATSETPGNMAIGASGYPRDAYLSGYYIGRELALLGINMNFAPTVDIYTNRASTVIGPRSFGNDPVRAGLLGAAFMKGQQTAGVIATAKHYPGHGDTDLDSHGVLPRINADFDVLWDRELIPYRILARENIPAIMSGHLSFPNTQAGSAPASLSSWFLQDILRGRIGFRGLVITDDLMMNGATAWAGSLSQAAKQALLSGNDIVMLSKTPSLWDPVWTSLLASMRQEPAFRERVQDAARRIVAVKLEHLRGETAVPYVPNLAKVEAGLPDPEGSRFFLDLAARSVTILKGKEDVKNVFPLTTERAGKVFLAGQYLDFFSAGRAAYPGASAYWYTSEPGAIEEMLSYARRADTVIFCLSDAEGLGVLRSLRNLGKRVIVFSVLSPVYLDQVSWVDGALAVYSYAPESFVAGFSSMLGRIPAQGQLPLQALPGDGRPGS
ncbi:glycosyl hydrolase, family 3 [Treponema primitia ZAS-2]|uniref:beta-N-acetylhexosaminidase n=2 Tax=Treponema primitia TaxID=88058 RepID=F5YP22_TREPZ|nr:glycosyl hydrolase, family 3 [Treponema primitia ZAS-2]